MSRISVVLFLVVVTCATAGVLRSFETVDVNDEEVLEAAEFAAKTINIQLIGKFHHRLVKVAKAQKQDIGITNYQLDLIVGMTTCKKQEVSYEGAKECDIQDGMSAYKKCTVTLFKDREGNYQGQATGCILISKKDI